jgi:hypothetical protein
MTDSRTTTERMTMHPFILLALVASAGAAEAPTQRVHEPDPWPPRLPPRPLTPEERAAVHAEEERRAIWRREQDERDMVARAAAERAEYAERVAGDERFSAAEEKRIRRQFMADVDKQIREVKGDREATKEASAMRRTLHELVRSSTLVVLDGSNRAALKVTFAYTNHQGERRARIVALDRVRWGASDWHRDNGTAWYLHAFDVERDGCPMRDFDIALIRRA